MAVGSPVSEVPDSEEEPLTSSPDPRAVAGPAEERPQHASPGTDGALGDDCETRNCNPNPSETSVHTNPQPPAFERSPDAPTPAHHRTGLPAERCPHSDLSLDHASASDPTLLLVDNDQGQPSITGEHGFSNNPREIEPASLPDHVHSSFTSSSLRSKTDPVKAIDETAQVPATLHADVAPPSDTRQSLSPRKPKSATQIKSSESTDIHKLDTPTKKSQETILTELKAQKAALIASLAGLPSIRALVAESKNVDHAVQGTDTEYTENEIMNAAQKLNQKHIKLLHEYNEIKDAGQGLMGLIADQRGVRIIEVQEEFGIDPKD